MGRPAPRRARRARSDRLAAAALVVAWALGCGGRDEEPASGATASSPAAQAFPPGVPGTDGALPVSFDVTLDAAASDGLVATIRHGTGAISFPGDAAPTPAFVYARQPWPEMGFTLYQALAVSTTDWRVVWFYCEGALLSWVDRESTSAPTLRSAHALGTCSDAAAPTTERVVLPASAPAPRPAAFGLSASGPSLTLPDGGLGEMTVGGTSWSVAPFAAVDCTACGGPGWYELHALYWDAARTRTCFGIFYLLLDARDRVLLEYSMCLPDLSDPASGVTAFAATWSGP